jgi:RNA polymerase sigma-70 factor (ECF subfamily)
MFVVAQRFVRDKMEAEDIVQEAFLKAFTKLDQYRAEVTFGAWLKRIVINKSIDALKSRTQRLIDLEDVHMSVVDSCQESSWMVEDHVSLDMVKAAITTLSDKYRYVVMLYLIEGYDHKEISDILNITEVASRTQLSRGKQKLKHLLKEKYYGTRS